MWRLVREGLRLYMRALLISWGFAVAISILIVAIIAIVGSVHDARNVVGLVGQSSLGLLIASMIAAFIVTGTERGESRVRLHAMLPLPIADVAASRVLLPAVLMLLGVAAAHASLGAVGLVRGERYGWASHLTVDVLGLLLLFFPQFGLAIREAIELRRRAKALSVIGATAFLTGAVAIMIASQLPLLASPSRAVALAVLDAAIMTFTVVLFVRRTQFTK